MRAIALELDTVLGDTRPLWRAWLADVSRRARIGCDIPDDRVAAAAELDRVLGGWHALLERFAADHAPVYVPPPAATNAAVRRLSENGVRLGVFTDAPAPLARVVLSHLGASRRLDAVESGDNALERLLERLGPDTVVVRSRSELAGLAS